MTISTTASRISYSGNGVTTIFSFPYRFLTNGDIVVVSVSSTGVETTNILTTDYTLTGAGDDAGGSVTMLVAPAAGTRLVIYRDTDIVQETDYISGDPFPAETHERALDRLTMIAQEIGSDADRAIKVPVGDSSSLSTTLPAAANRLDKFIAFDATTGATELSTVTQTQVASAVAAAYAAGSTADAVTYLPEGTGAVSTTVQVALRNLVVNVKTFAGAVGDGSTDDTVAIQAAIDHAASVRGAVYFPPNATGQYYKTTAQLNIPSSVYIYGDSPQAVTIMGVGLGATDYVLSADLAATSNYFFGIKGITLRSLDQVPKGLLLKNVSYVSVHDTQIYNLLSGVYLEGTNTFSLDFEKLVLYQIAVYGVRYNGFNGGGHHVYSTCTFSGNTGLLFDATSVTDGLNINGSNFEACVTNSLSVLGSVGGLSLTGNRTEACTGDDFLINPAIGAIVSGLAITGNSFTANSASSTPVTLGGTGGQVRGFNISGNRVGVGANTQFVKLNGDGESGVISGNYFTDTSAVPINAQRAGVIVFGNENAAGKCLEYWGTSVFNMAQSTYGGTGTGFTVAPTGTIKYGVVGNTVTLDIPGFSGTSNATTFTITGGPVAIRPAVDKDLLLRVQDNGGANVMGLLRVKTTGVIELYASMSGAAFTASGTKSISPGSVTYTL